MLADFWVFRAFELVQIASPFYSINFKSKNFFQVHMFFMVSRAFLASDLKFGVILRYCAICAQNPFSYVFQHKSGQNLF